MINWSKYFDRIYCIHYTPYTERKELILFLLNRVGILNSGIFQWQYTYGTLLDKKFNKHVKQIKNPNNKYFNWSITSGHYNCIRDALYNGYEKILILEDDARFLRDLNKVLLILEHRPEDYNIILYDKFVYSFTEYLQQFKPINLYYSTFKRCGSSCCYLLDKIGMNKMKTLIETDPQISDGYFYNSLIYLKDVKYCCSNKNIAVQGVFKKTFSYSLTHNILAFQQFYSYARINWDDYMIRKDGSIYRYGETIDK